MRRRTAATCIAILAGLAGLLQYTLLQMAIVSDLHQSRQCTHLNFLVSMYSTKKFAQTQVNTIAICNRICTVPCKQAVRVQISSVQKFVRSRVNVAVAVQKFVRFHRSRVNARWNRASFCPCKNLSGPV